MNILKNTNITNSEAEYSSDELSDDENCSLRNRNNLNIDDSSSKYLSPDQIKCVNSANSSDYESELSSYLESTDKNSSIEGIENPITFKSPLINIKENGSPKDRSNINIKNKNIEIENHISSTELTKTETKFKHKSKLIDPNMKVKNKFSENSLKFISANLKGQVFSGWVEERKFVDKLNDYRDIIEVDEWEDELNRSLKSVMYGVKGVMDGTKWINITVPSSHTPSYCLWVLLDSPPFPGHYWMQITDVTAYQKMGLKICIKMLRQVHAFDGESFAERQKRLKGEMSPDEWKQWALAVTSLNLKLLCSNSLSLLAPSNIASSIRLIVVLIMTLVIALTKFLERSCDFLLRLLREIGIFIHHGTPFAQSVIGFFEKVIGGFFLLISMVYRDFRQPRRPPPTSVPPRPMTYVPEKSWVFK